MQVVSSNPIFIEDRPGTKNETRRGSNLKRPILIRNRSNQKTEIDIWVDATDSKSEPLLRWCNFSEQSPLILNANEVKEVILNFQIPASAIPDLYNYEIRVEAANQYPGKIFRRPQQLRVLPSDKDAILGTNEPRFSVQPISISTNPLILEAGKQVEIKVAVENRSRRVDRFYLCPELTPEFTFEWYTVKYPESDLDIPGLVKETDGLELNPGCAGEISLILHPPKYTPAGNYSPTLRLISSNREELVLLDIVYLHILPDETLDVRMHPQEQKIPQEPGKFEVDLINLGNITRKLRIIAKDEEEIFSYSLKPSVVLISPGKVQTVALKAKPKKWWLRRWKGKPLAIPFYVELENTDLNTPFTQLPQQLPQGKLIWQSRAWWLLWLFILLGLLGIGGIAFFILKEYFPGEIPPRPVPEIEKFEPTQKVYQESKQKEERQNYISLDWQISHLSEVEKVTVIQLEDNQETNRKSYIFKDKIPQELKFQQLKESNSENRQLSTESFIEENKDNNNLNNNNFSGCKEVNENKGKDKEVKDKDEREKDLSCINIPTTATKAGNYTFKIEVFSKQNPEQPVSSQITDTITIKPATPLPLPKIDRFSSTKPTYVQKNPDLSLQNNIENNSAVSPIVLNWEISHPTNVEKFEIIGLAPDGSISSKPRTFELKDYKDNENTLIPQKLKKEGCQLLTKQQDKSEEKLLCNNFIVKDAEKAGDYIFKMTLIPKGGNEENAIIKQTPLIKIKPIDTPQILTFSPANPTYQELGSPIDLKSTPNSRPGFPPIRLNWQITNPSKIKELQIIGTNDGSLSEYQRYAMFQGKPYGLEQKCEKLKSQPILNCSMVETKANKPGSYTFKIVALLKEGKNNTEIIKATEAIKIQPKPPTPPKPPKPATPVKISSFKVNGEEVISNPKQTFEINKQRRDASIALSWQVEKGEDIKVELLPAPGVVNTQGFIEYPLNKPPSNETIILKVTNKAGEQKFQSVVIQTIESTPSNQNQSSSSSSTNNNSGANTPIFQRSTDGTDSTTPSTPSNSDKLSPIELPPTAE